MKNKITTSDFINPLHWKKGNGAKVILSNDLEYIDMCSGATVANLGQGNERIAKAVYEAMSKLSNTFFYSNEYRLKYNEMLLKELPDGYSQILFFSGGGEAIDSALKLAMHVKKKSKIVASTTSYHGRTFGGLSLSKLPFTFFLDDILKFDMAYWFNFPSNGKKDAAYQNRLVELERILKTNNNIAALLIEPYQGDGGLIFPDKTFFQKIEKLCSQYDVLLMLDEIQSGFCRTGPLFAFFDLGITPDVICFGKAMANGLPGSGLILKNGLLDHLGYDMFATSFGGNPMTMSAAVEVLKILKEDNISKNVPIKGKRLEQGLIKLMNKFPSAINDVRGKGMVWGIELSLNTNYGTLIGDMFLKKSFDNGLIFMPLKGKDKNVAKISPPLVIKEEEIDHALKKLNQVFTGIK